MKWLAGIVALLLPASAGFAQMTVEEALQRMHERQAAEAAQRAAAATQPSTATTRPDALTIGRMSHEAWSALEAKRYADATKEFNKLLEIDHRDANALEGRAICNYELSHYKAADADAELAYKLRSRGDDHPSRQMVLALAVSLVMDENPMRAVKIVHEYTDPLQNDNKYDEEMQNVAGTALWRATAETRRSPFYSDSLSAYHKYDAKLAAQRNDGKARWGDQWIESAAAERKWSAYDNAVDVAATASTNYDQAVLARQNAARDMEELTGGFRLHSDAEAARWTAAWKRSLVVEAAAKKQYDSAERRLNAVPKPPFPDKIEPTWREPR